ncbi:MAG: leucine-rich repeat protein [bacterium]|nr:leucine-rich repeat protein [bacterium]
MNDKFAESGENFADFQMTKPYFENGTMYRKVPKASWKNKDIKRLVLPPGTVVIEEQAFCGCMRLEAAELSNSLEEIAAGAFWGCMALRHINFPDTLQSLGKFCFWGCSSLTEITIPDGVEKIPAWSFLGCSGLVRLCLPAKLKSIDSWAFSCCSSLMVVEIPKGTQEIGEGAFSKCSALRRISIPDTVLHIGKNALPDNAEGLTVVCSRNSAAYSYAQHYGLSCECPYEDDKRVVVRHKKHVRPERENSDWNYPDDSADATLSSEAAFNAADSERPEINVSGSPADVVAEAHPEEGFSASFRSKTSDFIHESSTIGELLASKSSSSDQAPKGNPLINVMIELSDSAKPSDQYDFKVYDSYEEAQKDILGKPADSHEPADEAGEGDHVMSGGYADTGISAAKSENAAAVSSYTAEAQPIDLSFRYDEASCEQKPCLVAQDAGGQDVGTHGANAQDVLAQGASAQDAGGQEVSTHGTNAQDVLAQGASAQDAGGQEVSTQDIRVQEADVQEVDTSFAGSQDIGRPEPEESAYLGTILSQAADSFGSESANSDDFLGADIPHEETMADIWDGSMDGYDNGRSPELSSYYRESVMPSIHDDYLADNRKQPESEHLVSGMAAPLKSILSDESLGSLQSRLAQAAREEYEARVEQEAREAQEARLVQEAREAQEARLVQEAREAYKARVEQEAREAHEARAEQETRDTQESRDEQDNGAGNNIAENMLPEETVLSHYLGEEKNVYIPSEINGKKVTALNDALFKGNNYIENVTIPEGVREIRKDAFRGCSALRNVVFSNTIVSIGEGAFRGCERLKKVILPEGLSEIGDKAFSGCSGLEAVTIPAGVTVIPKNAFAGSALRIVICPDNSYAAAWADANMIMHAQELSDAIGEVVSPQFAAIPVPDDIEEDDPEELAKREKAKSKYLKRMSNAGKNKKWKKNF